METESLNLLLIILSGIVFIAIIVIIAMSEKNDNKKMWKKLNEAYLDSIKNGNSKNFKDEN